MTRSPILFLIFNRPDTTAKVFEAIRQAKPPKLYIAADGPREGRTGEADLCEQTRQVALAVDWECEVNTLFRTQNLGCKIAVSSAINWFFEHELEGIILEDDCLPTIDFFRFCDELLEKYRDDPRIGSITGDNFISSHWMPDESYYFSKFPHIWGWATWRRAWDYYDVSLSEWPKLGKKFLKEKVFPRNLKATKYWHSILNKVYEKEIDTWDYQWSFTCLKNDWICCIPKKNLVSNIGFGPNATHTTNPENKLSRIEISKLDFPLSHPLHTSVADAADERILQEVYQIDMHGLSIERLRASLSYRISLLKKFLKNKNL